MIKDDNDGRVKVLVFGGMVALALGLGYSMGLNHVLDSPASQIRLGPMDPDSIVLLKRAGERSRAAGDAKTAEWLEQACDEGSNRLLAWARVKAHGTTRVQAAAR
jgi:hypothetical protein